MGTWPRLTADRHRRKLEREDKSCPAKVEQKSRVRARPLPGYAIPVFWCWVGTAPAMSTLSCSGTPSSSSANKLRSITIAPARSSLAVAATIQFTATGTYGDRRTRSLASASWSSSATDMATISAVGPATAVAPGTTKITATSEGVSGTTSLSLEVERTRVSIAVGRADPSLVVGNTIQFTATGTFNEGSVEILTGLVMWSSTAPGVASINSGGLATGSATGDTTITASSQYPWVCVAYHLRNTNVSQAETYP